MLGSFPVHSLTKPLLSAEGAFYMRQNTRKGGGGEKGRRARGRGEEIN